MKDMQYIFNKNAYIYLNNRYFMLSAIKGVYRDGQVILEETPETTGPIEVLVTFTTDLIRSEPPENKKRIFGIGKGSVLYMSPDFNDPLDDLKEYM
jgi:hypothetical protein